MNAKSIRSLSLAAAVLFLAGAALATGTNAPAADAKVARGKLLVGIGGCADCHTPTKMTKDGPEKDATMTLAGHPAGMPLPPAPALPPGPWVATVAGSMTAWNGPWGTTFTANLTPDEETGLGKWTEQNFIDTMRNGRHLGQGRQILPPMPVTSLQALGDDDLRAIFAFLRTLPPVSNRVPAPLPPPARTAAK